MTTVTHASGHEVALTRHPRRALVVCCTLAFVLPWAVWGTTIGEQRGLIDWHVPQSLAFWIGLPVAYLAAAALSGGPGALLALVAGMLRWRVGWRWYGVAVGLSVGLPLLGLLVGPFPAGAGAAAGSFAQLPTALLVETALFWLTEEPTWRGFVLPRVELWLPPGWAGIAVGVLWAVWHLPLFAIQGSFQAGLPFGGFVLLTVATSIILTWLYHVSGGSVLLCAVYHGVVDVTFATTGVLTTTSASFWTVVAGHVVAAGLIWWRSVALRRPRTVGRS